MGWQFYVFALFVAALLAGIAFLFAHLMKKNTAEGKLAEMDREQRVLALYAKVDEMIEAAEAYVEESKAEMDAKLVRVTELCVQLEDELRRVGEYARMLSESAAGAAEVRQQTRPAMQPSPQVRPEPPPMPIMEPEEIPREEQEQEQPRLTKEQVAALHNAGLDAAQIAEQLGYSRGEVAFMLKLAAGDKNSYEYTAQSKSIRSEIKGEAWTPSSLDDIHGDAK